MNLLKIYTTSDLPFTLLILVIGMLIVCFVFIILFVMHLRSRELNFVIEKANAEKKHFAALFNLFSNEKEMLINRISQELHDNINQLLVSLSLKLNTLKNGDQGITIAALQADCNGIINQIRSLSYLLNSDYVKQYELHTALDSLVENYRSLDKENLPTFSFMVHGTVRALAKDIELIVYRSVQEFISNIIKHAQATYCELHLFYNADELLLVLYDNGRGFNFDGVKKGLGLSSIQNKEVLMDGTIAFSFPKVGGTKIEMNIPYSAQPLHINSEADFELLSKRIAKLSIG